MTIDQLRTWAAILCKKHGRKHWLLNKRKGLLGKRPFTEEECREIIEAGKTFAGQEPDPIDKRHNHYRMAATVQLNSESKERIEYATEAE